MRKARAAVQVSPGWARSPRRGARSRLSSTQLKGSPSRVSSAGRSLSPEVLQPREARLKSVQPLGQLCIGPQADRTLDREGLGKQAAVGGLKVLGVQHHDLQQERQALAYGVAEGVRRCHGWTPSLLTAPRGAPALGLTRTISSTSIQRSPNKRCRRAVVCAAILVLQVLIAAPAGYALAKLPFRGRPLLFGAVVVALMIPMQVPAIPLYVAIAYAGLLNSYTALIAPFIISALAIFLFRQFFLTYPDEVLDAARLDGFSEWSIVWRLMIPAIWPAIAAFATLSIIAHWNDLYWPLIVVTQDAMMTPPTGLASFRASGDSTGDTGALMAGGVIITAPLVVGFVFAQAHLLRGLKMVAVK